MDRKCASLLIGTAEQMWQGCTLCVTSVASMWVIGGCFGCVGHPRVAGVA